MRCHEVIEQLPILAYNELDDESAARCDEHLTGCPACQAEWNSIRNALSLLDQAPRRATQVDLATICLRIAREQRRSRAVGRWAVGALAAAAVLIGVFATQLLAVDLEPGRLIVAWNAPPEAGPIGPAPVDRVGAPQEMIAGGPGAGQATQPDLQQPTSVDAPGVADHESNLLVLLLEGATRPRHRGASSFGDLDLEEALHRGLSVPTEASDGEPRTSAPRPVTYSELRRQLLDEPKRRPTRTAQPDA